jgi:hypothetical protein
MKLNEQEKAQLRQEKKEKIIKIRKTLSELSEEQRQAIADKYGIVTVEGHLLTPHNQCFLVAQSEMNFTVVGGFQQWRKAGRSVRKGEHGFLIFVPSRQQETENPVDNFLESDEDVKFYTATVFDISQTEVIVQQNEAA